MRTSINMRFLGLSGLLILTTGNFAFGHGLIQNPPSRNWFCGAITKPDQAGRTDAQYSQCADVFTSNAPDGYRFMAVLTHAKGRDAVTPLPKNVCGFDSETWNGGATPWDKAIDWPTNTMSPGRQQITWNISWGPHFDDTEEFKYWITKPGFNFQSGKSLTWDDFESAPFCSLKYDDKNPTANPDITSDKVNALFHTTCTIPQRSGHHVIYGEWGRNQWTLERFHGCIDAQFSNDDDGDTQAHAYIALQPNVTEFIGSGALTLQGDLSQGSNLQYHWSVNSTNPGLYTLENATQANATLRLKNPTAASQVSVSLTVSNSKSSHTATTSLKHVPAVSATWLDLGQAVSQAKTLKAGDSVIVRAVLNNGQDRYFPTKPLLITTTTTAAQAWPYALATAVNEMNSALKMGALGSNNQITPVKSATANRLYAADSAGYVSAFVQITPGNSGGGTQGIRCDSGQIDAWNNGFVVNNFSVVNTGNSALSSWSVKLNFEKPVKVVNAWNGRVAVSGNSVTVTNESYNAQLAPGQSTLFGFQGSTSGLIKMPNCQ